MKLALKNYSNYNLYNALEENANIEDYRFLFY